MSRIAAEFGTPTYVYSKASILNRVEMLAGALEHIDSTICYSVKSNSSGAILRMMAQKGLGADIVSGGELFRALKAGISPSKIVYSGVGKTAEEIRFALASGISLFNVESAPELHLLSELAREAGQIAPVALRINPDIDAKTHAHTTTGKKENKFGIAYTDALGVYVAASKLPHINPIGIDVHLGSPILTLDPYQQALERLSSLIEQLRSQGIPIQALDMGGGFGIVYRDEQPFSPLQYAALVAPFVQKHNVRLIVEPGRSIVGNSAVLLTRLTYVKETAVKCFYICDAGMNDLIRPAFYGSFHRIVPVVQPASTATRVVDVAGPICESSDVFARDREMEVLAQGDVLAIMSAGAYGFAMASTYNSRPLPPEVLVDGASYSVIRRRQTYDDLIALETPGC